MAKKKTTRKPYKKARKPAGPKKRAAKSPRESATGKQASGSKTGPKRARTKKTEIVAMDADAGTLIPNNKRNSLVAWFNLYMGIEAGEPDSNTFKAKQGDLSRFVNYFRQGLGIRPSRPMDTLRIAGLHEASVADEKRANRQEACSDNGQSGSGHTAEHGQMDSPPAAVSGWLPDGPDFRCEHAGARVEGTFGR